MYIDIETSAGVKCGDGPIITAREFETVKRLDKAGTIRFSMPATDERAALAQAKRVARAWRLINGVVTEIGAGIIDEIAVKADSKGSAELDVSGDDLLRELTYAHVGKLEIGTDITPATTGPADIAALFPAGWSLDVVAGHNATLKAIHHQYEGESCLAALCKLVELTGEHFRLGSGRKVIWMQDDRPDSGIRAIQGGDPVGLETNLDVCLITSLDQTQDTHDCYIGRVYAFGVGDGDARVTLDGAANNHAGDGYTIGSDSKGFYLEHTATWNAYGIERYMSFKDVNDATTLAEQAYEWMSRRLAPQKSYRLSVTKLDRELLVGSTIRVIYKRVVDGFVAIDVDDDLVILETTTQVDVAGARTVALQVATTDAWPDSDTSAMVDGLGQAQNFYTHAQGSGGGAPADAQYLVLLANTVLTDERIFTPDSTLSVVDDGAGGAYHIGVNASYYPPPTARGDMLAANATPNWALLPLAGSSGYILTRNATDPTWSNTLDIGADANIGLIIKGHSATQSGHLQEWQTSAGAARLLVNEACNLEMMNTTFAAQTGIIFKGADRFIHNFNYGNNGTVTTVGKNTFLGVNAGNLTMGSTATNSNDSSYNVGVGVDALVANTFGQRNTAVGYQSLYKNTTGDYNTAIGENALYENTIGYYNAAVGISALQANVGGYGNSALGKDALTRNIDAYYNTAMGYEALAFNTTGINNSAVGTGALIGNVSGDGNSGIGVNSLYRNYYGDNNAAVGFQALYCSAYALGSDNSAVGMNALYTNFSGCYNSALGDSALYSNTMGYYNTAVGNNALYNTRPRSKAISGFANYGGTVPGTVRATSAGHGLPAGTTANVRISGSVYYDGLYTVTRIDADLFYFTAAWVSGNSTAWWGIETEGWYNTGVGVNAGYSITTGQGNSFLGYEAGHHASQKVDAINSMALGNGAYTTADNQIVIGAPSITQTLLYGLVGIETTPAAQLDVCQVDAVGGIPCLELDQDDVDYAFINFVGDTAADQTKSISTINGDGAVTGPKNFSASAGWEYVGMVKIEVNGQTFWVPYYQPDTA